LLGRVAGNKSQRYRKEQNGTDHFGHFFHHLSPQVKEYTQQQ
jgi:hypothetical protein